ncbi:MAG: hypothetical protein R3A50_09785 [Saprospiraceae bacterium]
MSNSQVLSVMSPASHLAALGVSAGAPRANGNDGVLCSMVKRMDPD